MKDLRCIGTRGKMVSKEDMRTFRILGVYNVVGEMESMSDGYVDDFIEKVCMMSESVDRIVESCMKEVKGVKNPLKVVSVITFMDEYSLNMYVMSNWEVYGRCKEEFLKILN